MSAPIVLTDEWKASNYDMIIDVRSPSEFLNDHIPGAVNMPVMSDRERHTIGKIYKQRSSFDARKFGAVFVARNIADQIEKNLQMMESDFTPLIHCWRGGQRSRAFAQICCEIGWRSYILKGGYKNYRRAIVQGLEEVTDDLKLIVIAGRTGSGKTDILKELLYEGAQVLDLEKLAMHRGSILGAIVNCEQPSQRLFESNLYAVLTSLDKNKPIYVESESSRIGNIQIPVGLWRQVTTAPMISINVPSHARASYLLTEYNHLVTDTSALEKLIIGMSKRHGFARTDFWQSLIESREWQRLAENLLKNHYDPAYDKSISRHARRLIGEIKQSDCQIDNFKVTAASILDISGG
jgi:tRNA 2-selenouridine synthase